MTCRFKTCRAVLTATVFAILPALAGTASAQAPAPASPDRLSWYGDSSAPNLSGVWMRADEAGGSSNTASRSKEGWQPWPPPLKPEFSAIWQTRVADAAAGKRTDDPVRGCLPPGMPRYMSGTNTPLLIIQTPGRVTQYRDGDPVRRIWLDGRSQPKPADLESFSNGNAVGRYEGQDLVTNVIGLKDQPIDSTGVPHSDGLVIAERYYRVDANTLKVDIELTDPTAYAAPMRTTVTYNALNDQSWEPKEFICTPRTNYHPETYVR